MKTFTDKSYWVKLYVGGPLTFIEQCCREHVLSGLCVTIKENKYIYTMGEETGVEIEFINYPKYPDSPESIWDSAMTLGQTIVERCHQGSFTIMDPDKVFTYDRRG